MCKSRFSLCFCFFVKTLCASPYSFETSFLGALKNNFIVLHKNLTLGPSAHVEGCKFISFSFDDGVEITFSDLYLDVLKYVLDTYYAVLGFPFYIADNLQFDPGWDQEDFSLNLKGKSPIKISGLCKKELLYLKTFVFYVVRPKKAKDFYLNRAITRLLKENPKPLK